MGLLLASAGGQLRGLLLAFAGGQLLELLLAFAGGHLLELLLLLLMPSAASEVLAAAASNLG